VKAKTKVKPLPTEVQPVAQRITEVKKPKKAHTPAKANRESPPRKSRANPPQGIEKRTPLAKQKMLARAIRTTARKNTQRRPKLGKGADHTPSPSPSQRKSRDHDSYF
jgi:hypothetical protein